MTALPQTFPYSSNIHISQQLVFCKDYPPVVSSNPKDETEIECTRRSFFPLKTRSGLITISLKEETQTKLNRKGSSSVLHEFEIVTESRIFKIPTREKSPGIYDFGPLDKKVKEIDAFATQKFQKIKNSSRCTLL